VSFAIEATPDSPGHVEPWRPQPWRDLGLSLGRLHTMGGIFGSAIVRAMLGQEESGGTLGAAPMQEYAMQPFGIPGGMEPGSRKVTPDAKKALAAHAHTVLALEEASIKYQRSGRVNGTVPQDLQMALDTAATWTAPR
jgi:hypothetical protein